MNELLLRCGDSAAALVPGKGAAIRYWTWHGHDILRPALPDADIADMASFPLVPFANRIGHGRLCDGIQLPPHPGERHSLHGIGWRRAWDVSVADRGKAALELHHAADATWPFDFHAEIDVRLGESALEQVLVVRNTGRAPMPVGAGFHPYFAIDTATRLGATWRGRWETSADWLPLSHGAVAPARDVPASGIVVNHCYTGWERMAVLDFDTRRVILTASEACSYLHCYRPDADSPFIALEPVSHVPNARQLREAGQAVTDLEILQPGATFTVSMSIEVVARART